MASIEELAIDRLRIRGEGNEFNNLSREFLSLESARNAVATGDYVPTPGQVNASIVLGEDIMVWSFDINDFVHISEFEAAGNQAAMYIELDGVNDYIQFSTLAGGAEDVLDFNKSWIIGCTFVGVQSGTDNKKMALFSNGGCHITLNRGGSNWGLYVTSNNDLYDATTRATANTWHAPGDFDRVLFTYNATTKRLKYFLGDPSTGTFAQRANMAIPQTMIDAQTPDGTLCIGKGFDGPGGDTFDGTPWDGGVDNLVVSDMEFTGPHLTEYFQTGEAFTAMELYDDLVGYAKLGEDTYPEVTDEKGNMTGGALHNGAADDFKPIPTME